MRTTHHLQATVLRLARAAIRGRAHTARGQGLVEYALVLVLVAIVVIGSLTMVGRRTSEVFDQVNCTLDGGPTHQDHGNGNSNRCN
jgi:pilus assembly protein Flp/PilA